MENEIKILFTISVFIFWFLLRKNIYWSTNLSTLKKYFKAKLNVRQTVKIILVYMYFWMWLPVVIFFLLFTLITNLTDLSFPYLFHSGTILFGVWSSIIFVSIAYGVLIKLYFIFIKGSLKRFFKNLSNSFYIEYTEIPESIRIRDIFFSELERKYASEAVDFVKANCKDAASFKHKHHLLKYALEISDIEGYILEFGVKEGKSINFIASNTKQTVFGFDSFEGLPESWLGANGLLKKGHFNLGGKLPVCLENVILVKGWFEDTLNSFINKNKHNVKLMHIDCDLYSSTFCVLESFKDRLVPGSLIIFDEFYNYHGWQNHEYKALMNFQKKYNINFEYMGFTDRRMLIKIVN